MAGRRTGQSRSLTGLARRWAFRRQGRDQAPLTLHRRRIYILPTRAGLGLALIIAAIVLASMNYSNSMGFFLGFGLGGLALVTMHHTHRGLNGLIVRPGRPGRGFPGEAHLLEIVLENPAPVPRRDIQLTALNGDRLDHGDVRPHESTRLTLSVTPSRRGPYRCRRFGLATSYPFGLFRAWCWIDLPLEGLAWPRPQSAPEQRARDDEGADSRRQEKGTEDFDQLRGYLPGDPVRRIAWRHYITRGELVLKEFADAVGESPVWFAWERSGPGDAEQRLARLAGWLLDAEETGRSWGLRLPGFETGPGRGDRQRREAMDALARFGDPTPEVLDD